MKLKNEIKMYRHRYGYTQQNVADLLGVSVLTYQKYENNPYSMSLQMFIKLCEIFDKDIATIFFTQELYNLYNKERVK